MNSGIIAVTFHYFFQNECKNRCGLKGLPWGGKNRITGIWTLSESCPGAGAEREPDSDPLLGPVAEPSPLEAARSMWLPLVWTQTIFPCFCKMLLLSFNAFSAVWLAPMVTFSPPIPVWGTSSGKASPISHFWDSLVVLGERGEVLVGQTGALSRSFLSLGVLLGKENTFLRDYLTWGLLSCCWRQPERLRDK